MCLTGDDAGCFFYGGLMEKKGKRVDSRSAYLFGAMNARGRAGFVCMYSLGKSYEEGMNGDGDIVQAYRWYDVLANSAAPKDLKAKASARRRALGGKMSASEISFATMLAGLPL